MNSKTIIISITMFLLLIFAGFVFTVFVINSEPTIEKIEGPTTKNNLKNKEKSILQSDRNLKEQNSFADQNLDRAKNNEKVVDQTLRSVRTNDSNIASESTELEITFYDGDQNKLLTNHRVEIEIAFFNEASNSDYYNTDKSGTVRIKTIKKGNPSFRVISQEYSDYSEIISLYSGKNVHYVKLYRGGTIEVRATNQENQIVKGLQIILPFSGDFPGVEKKISSISFNAIEGKYVFTRIPIGNQDIIFKAKGYLETSQFKINVDSNNVTYLEIKLQSPRKLFFDLDLIDKPNYIQILKTPVLRGCGFQFFPPVGSFPGDLSINPLDSYKSFKNQNNKYEFLLEEREVPFLSIYVDNYGPQTIDINQNQDIYKISLLEVFETKIKIIDELGNAVKGANVTCYANQFFQTVITGKEGIVNLKSIIKNSTLSISVSHPDFAELHEQWLFEINEKSLKTIVLLEGKEVKGEIKFKGKSVEGAEVHLVEIVNGYNPLFRFSDPNGNYAFSHLNDNKKAEYYVQASHPSFGTVNSEKFTLADKTKEIILDLIEENSLLIKLVDKNDSPLSNQILILQYNIGNCEVQQKTTNEKGECQFLNLFKGSHYSLRLANNHWKIENKMITIPAGEMVIKAEENNLKTISILKPDGSIFNGLIFIANYWGSATSYRSFNSDQYEMGRYYLDAFWFEKNGSNKNLHLEVPGYAVTEMETFEKKEDIPKEFRIQLQLGRDLKIKVIDIDDNKSIVIGNVEVSYGGLLNRSCPTNNQGEIIFSHLIGKVTLLVKSDGYAQYQCDVDMLQTNEMVIKLTKSGQLKGHLPIKNETGNYTFLTLIPNHPVKNQFIEGAIQIGVNGNFFFNQLLPGEYSISVETNFNEGKIQEDLLPNKIIIESGKTTEINLEAIIKK